MASIKDDRGYNQGFKPSKALTIRTKRRTEWILNEIDCSKSNDILEIGCGTGELAYNISENKNFNVFGTDICEPFINEAIQKYKKQNLSFQILDFHHPEKLGEQKFDYIIGNGILHHLFYTLENSLESLRNLLKDNGKIIFIEPNLYNPYCFLIFGTIPYFRLKANLEPAEMAFSKRYISKLLEKTHYKDIKVTYKDFLLPNTPDKLIQPVIVIGNLVEKVPVLKLISQSLFISATK